MLETSKIKPAARTCKADRWLPVVAIAALLLFLGSLLNPTLSFYRWDTLIYLFPLLVDMNQQWMQGHIPLWTSDIANGTHLLGNISLGVFNPLHLIHRLLPFVTGYKIYVFITYSLATLFAFLWFRKGLKLSPYAALAGAFIYGFSGYTRGLFDSQNFMILPWIPLLFWSLHQKRSSPWSILTPALAWALMVLCGDTQQLVLTGVVSFFYLLTLEHPLQKFQDWLLGGLAAVLLTAPQWLPTFLIAGESYRAEGLPYLDAVELSFHPLRTLEFFIPHLFGTHGEWLAPDLFGADAVRRSAWSASHHLPLLALCLFFFSLFRKWTRLSVWAVGVMAASLLFSFGRFLPGFEYWQSLPIIEGFRYPEKYLLWLPFALSVYTAYQIDSFKLPSKKTTLISFCFFTALLGAGIAAQISQDISCSTISSRAGLFVLLVISCAVLWLPVCRKNFPVSIFLLIVFQLVLPWHIEKPLESRDLVEQPPPVIRDLYLQGEPGGKLYADAHVELLPLPVYDFGKPDQQVEQVIRFNTRLRYNTSRWWGIRTSLGFSPLEYGPMKTFKDTHGQLVLGERPDPQHMARYISLTGSRWVFTSSSQWEAMLAHGLRGETLNRWTSNTATSLLVKVTNVSELSTSGADLYRPEPGTLILDIKEEVGIEPIRISETASSGWQLKDPTPETVNLGQTPEGFLTIQGASKGDLVHLRFTPPGWKIAWRIHLGGWLFGLLVIIVQRKRNHSG